MPLFVTRQGGGGGGRFGEGRSETEAQAHLLGQVVVMALWVTFSQAAKKRG